jgi:hypothetical protein
MRLEDIIKQIENVSKKEIKRVSPGDFKEIKELIQTSKPTDIYEKMILGYLISICAEYAWFMHEGRKDKCNMR